MPLEARARVSLATPRHRRLLLHLTTTLANDAAPATPSCAAGDAAASIVCALL